jgi:hypothetical protein
LKLFVSYTRRDGMVTRPMLILLDMYLRGICTPFIHELHESTSRWQQFLVLRALVRSHAILLIESPAVRTSGWVKLELWIGRLLLRPIVRLRASDFGISTDEDIAPPVERAEPAA